MNARTARRIRFTLPLLLFAVPLNATRATTVDAARARVVDVTAYPDRAEVVREVTVDVPLGSSRTPSKTRPGVVLWKLTLAPHEKKDVVLAYTVRYPKDMLVAGLN